MAGSKSTVAILRPPDWFLRDRRALRRGLVDLALVVARARAEWGVLGLALALMGAGCSRKAEIANEPDAGLIGPSVPQDQSPLSSVAADVDAGSFLACSERPSGEGCRGVNDFPCNFQPWAVEVVTSCQTESGCVSNGRVVVEMGNAGCVVDLLMSEPNQAFARCALERWGAHRCECLSQSVEVHLGYGNEGCSDRLPCQSGEFRCPTGQICAADGYCHIESAGVGGDSG